MFCLFYLQTMKRIKKRLIVTYINASQAFHVKVNSRIYKIKDFVQIIFILNLYIIIVPQYVSCITI